MRKQVQRLDARVPRGETGMTTANRSNYTISPELESEHIRRIELLLSPLRELPIVLKDEAEGSLPL